MNEALIPIYRRYAFLMGVMLALAVGLPGCGTLGGYDIDTARKAAVVANGEIRSGYLLLESLVESRAINSTDARRAQSSLDDARSAIRASFTAIQTAGDPSQAESNTERALVALDVAMGILAGYVEQPN